MKKLLFVIPLILFAAITFCQTRIREAKSPGQVLNEKYCSGLFRTNDAVYFDMLEISNNSSAMGYINILDWLQGRVAGLQVYSRPMFVRVPYIRNQQAAVYINEVPVNPDILSMLPVAEIAMIKIMKNSFIGGWRGPGGVIAIYTIQGDEESSE